MKKLLSTLIVLSVLAWAVLRNKNRVTNLMPVGANLNIQHFKFVFVRSQDEIKPVAKLMGSRGWRLVKTELDFNRGFMLTFYIKDADLCRHTDD